jgi:hypothetical protein
VTWRKVKDQAKRAGNVNPKILYAAIRAGRLRAARVGAGRNFLVADEWLDQYLTAQSEALRAEDCNIHAHDGARHIRAGA